MVMKDSRWVLKRARCRITWLLFAFYSVLHYNITDVHTGDGDGDADGNGNGNEGQQQMDFTTRGSSHFTACYKITGGHRTLISHQTSRSHAISVIQQGKQTAVRWMAP